MGFGVWGFGFRVLGFGFRVSGFEFKILGLGLSGVWCRVSGVGCRMSGVGCRVSGVGRRVDRPEELGPLGDQVQEPVLLNQELSEERVQDVSRPMVRGGGPYPSATRVDEYGCIPCMHFPPNRQREHSGPRPESISDSAQAPARISGGPAYVPEVLPAEGSDGFFIHGILT